MHRLAYEDLGGPAFRRERAADRLAKWLGLSARADFVRRVVTGLAPVMATAPPRPGRWRDRWSALAPAVTDPRIVDLAARLS